MDIALSKYHKEIITLTNDDIENPENWVEYRDNFAKLFATYPVDVDEEYLLYIPICQDSRTSSLSQAVIPLAICSKAACASMIARLKQIPYFKHHDIFRTRTRSWFVAPNRISTLRPTDLRVDAGSVQTLIDDALVAYVAELKSNDANFRQKIIAMKKDSNSSSNLFGFSDQPREPGDETATEPPSSSSSPGSSGSVGSVGSSSSSSSSSSPGSSGSSGSSGSAQKYKIQKYKDFVLIAHLEPEYLQSIERIFNELSALVKSGQELVVKYKDVQLEKSDQKKIHNYVLALEMELQKSKVWIEDNFKPKEEARTHIQSFFRTLFLGVNRISMAIFDIFEKNKLLSSLGKEEREEGDEPVPVSEDIPIVDDLPVFNEIKPAKAFSAFLVFQNAKTSDYILMHLRCFDSAAEVDEFCAVFRQLVFHWDIFVVRNYAVCYFKDMYKNLKSRTELPTTREEMQKMMMS